MTALIYHNCPVNGSMEIEAGKPCNWCDYLENQSDEKNITNSELLNRLIEEEKEMAALREEKRRYESINAMQSTGGDCSRKVDQVENLGRSLERIRDIKYRLEGLRGRLVGPEPASNEVVAEGGFNGQMPLSELLRHGPDFINAEIEEIVGVVAGIEELIFGE